MLFLALLAITIYQIFSPGSTFRYWLCKRGCISGHEMSYVVNPLKNPLGVSQNINLFQLDRIKKTTRVAIYLA